MKYSSLQIRNIWLKFFEEKNHYVVPSASLIPINDESLLWINSGVATLKSYFDGSEQPPSKRLTNSQKSIRTGDIENVGVTARHHTFFEMLGNFSIGDYFKSEAIEWAWELLTSPDQFNIPADKLYITVFEEDQEAFDKWVSIGVPSERIFKMGRKTNFWDMGSGPCGPSTEIFFDRGDKYSKQSAEELIVPDLENDRFVEIWNIVFSQYNNDGSNNYSDLSQRNIDTGAGLERLASILQNTPTNFETDLFKPIILKIEEIIGKKYEWDYIPGELSDEQEFINKRYKAIADFSRSTTFALSDGASIGPTGRGYVLRRLLRKAAIYGKALGMNTEFIYKLVPVIADIMKDFYPEVSKNADKIQDLIKKEETAFLNTLTKASLLLEDELSKLDSKTLPAKIGFKLFESHGLPFEVLNDLLTEKGISIDKDEFDKLFEDFSELSKSNAKQTEGMSQQENRFRGQESTKFIGYDNVESNSKVIAIENDGTNTFVAFDTTPFYATSGGQEFDTGTIDNEQVISVQKNGDNVFIHEVLGVHEWAIGSDHNLSISTDRRTQLENNHTGTHLLFSAMEEVFGTDIPQVGSKVETEWFRFDFALHTKPELSKIIEAQDLVNKWISEDISSETNELTQKEAKELGATFLEGTKYSDIVRVVKFGDVAIDLCGGTHSKSSSTLGQILITKLESKGSGTYRLEAVTTKDSIDKFVKNNIELKVEELKSKITNISSTIDSKDIEATTKTIVAKVNDLRNESPLSLTEKLDSYWNEFKQLTNSFLKDKSQKQIQSILSDSTTKVITIDSLELDAKEIREVALPLMETFKDKVLLISVAKGENTNLAIVLGQDNVETLDREKLSKLTEGIQVRGGGSRALYQYGGASSEVKTFMEKLLTVWE